MEIQNDISEKQLEEEDLSEKEGKWALIELRLIPNRWESERGHRVGREKRSLLTSQEWVSIQLGKQIGRNERQEMEKAEQWGRFWRDMIFDSLWENGAPQR